MRRYDIDWPARRFEGDQQRNAGVWWTVVPNWQWPMTNTQYRPPRNYRNPALIGTHNLDRVSIRTESHYPKPDSVANLERLVINRAGISNRAFLKTDNVRTGFSQTFNHYLDSLFEPVVFQAL